MRIEYNFIVRNLHYLHCINATTIMGPSKIFDVIFVMIMILLAVWFLLKGYSSTVGSV
jgi:hypothetical protein